MKDFLKQVKVLPLNCSGTILLRRESPGFVQFFVRYWFDGKIQEEWLYEHEIGEV